MTGSALMEARRAPTIQAALLAAVLVTIGCEDPSAPPDALPDAWTAVAAGDFHTCALDTEGAAYCWGSNTYGQLGLHERDLSPWPRRVDGAPGFVALTAGFGHTCGLTADGTGYCWGLDRDGQLGDGTGAGSAEPRPVAGSWRLRAISAGHSHTCALTVDRQALCWGDNSHGQLGTGPLGGGDDGSDTPILVEGGDLELVSVAAGHTHTCGAGTRGRTYCWGANERAQLGTAGFTPSSTPVAVHTHEVFVRVSAGFETSCGLTAAGRAWCWGSNQGGALGVSGIELAGNPLQVQDAPALNAISVGAVGHVCGVSWDGRVYCWGRGGQGEFGNPADGSSDGAAAVDLSGAGPIVDVASGLGHRCALTLAGEIHCWGSGGSGQLGDGSHSHRADPAPVAAAPAS